VSLFAELILIVAGILIALYIDGWVQDRQDRARETAYLELLRDDLLIIEDEVAQYVAFQESIVATGKAFLDAVSSADSSAGQRSLQGMLSEISVRRTLSIDSAVYADLTSTGNLQLIRDPELRRHVVQYFASVERSELIAEKNSKEYVDGIFVPFLLDAGVTINVDQSVLAAVAETSEALAATLGTDFTWPRDNILQQSPRASAWDDFRRQVLFRMRIATGGRLIGERIIASTRELRAEIEKELSRRQRAQ
jgi:hypothetical protein